MTKKLGIAGHLNPSLRVYVVGGGFQYIKMFDEEGFEGARSVQEADIVCFTGGEDVDPSLYGEKPLNTTFYNKERDDFEADVWATAVILNKPCVGICRGGQFLNVMNEGRMWQHVNNHGTAKGHAVFDVRTGEVIHGMTSTHHQMMIPNEEAEVIALAEEATYKQSFTELVELKNPVLEDAEVLWYPKTLSFCFQPHPEYRPGPCRDYFMDLLEEFVIPAC